MTTTELIKLSSPGWTKKCTEAEATWIMKGELCLHCIKEIEEHFGSTFETMDLSEMLWTPCGCEYWFGEEDTQEDCYERIQEELER